MKNLPLIEDVEDCQRIWAAVLFQALRDATFGLYRKYEIGSIKIDKRVWTPPTPYLPHARVAQLWVLDPGLDFEDVCGYVGASPEAVYERALFVFKEVNKFLPEKYLIRGLNEEVLR